MPDPKGRDLRAMSPVDLEQRLASLRKELLDLRLKLRTSGTTEHPHQLRSVRRQIARVQTVLRLAALAQDRGERAQQPSRTTVLHEHRSPSA